MKIYVHFWSYLTRFFLEWEMLQMKVVEKIKMHIFMFSNACLRKSRRLRDNVEKYSTARHATHDSISHEHYMMDT